MGFEQVNPRMPAPLSALSTRVCAVHSHSVGHLAVQTSGVTACCTCITSQAQPAAVSATLSSPFVLQSLECARFSSTLWAISQSMVPGGLLRVHHLAGPASSSSTATVAPPPTRAQEQLRVAVNQVLKEVLNGPACTAEAWGLLAQVHRHAGDREACKEALLKQAGAAAVRSLHPRCMLSGQRVSRAQAVCVCVCAWAECIDLHVWSTHTGIHK